MSDEMTKVQFFEALKEHHVWLKDSSKGERLKVRYITNDVCLKSLSLRKADFRKCWFYGYDLSYSRLSQADFTDACLLNCSFHGAYMSGAKLHGVDARSANFELANLNNTDFTQANLFDCNFKRATMRRTKFTGSNLRSTNFDEVDLTHSKLIIYKTGKWCAWIQPKTIQIGCQRHSVEQWKSFSNTHIDSMNKDALAYWKKNKDILFTLADSFKN